MSPIGIQNSHASRLFGESEFIDPRNVLKHQTVGIFRVYSLFRIVLSSILFISFITGTNQNTLGINDPALFYYSCLFYMAINALTLVFSLLRNRPFGRSVIIATLISDIVLLAILMKVPKALDALFMFIRVMVLSKDGRATASNMLTTPSSISSSNTVKPESGFCATLQGDNREVISDISMCLPESAVIKSIDSP